MNVRPSQRLELLLIPLAALVLALGVEPILARLERLQEVRTLAVGHKGPEGPVLTHLRRGTIPRTCSAVGSGLEANGAAASGASSFGATAVAS